MGDAIERAGSRGGALAPRQGPLTKQAIVTAMARWSAAYQRPAGVDVLAVYHDALHDFADDVVDLAMRRAVAESDYPATPAKVRQYAESIIRERLEAAVLARQDQESREYRERLIKEEAAAKARVATMESWTGPTSDPAEAVARYRLVAEHEAPMLRWSIIAEPSEGGGVRVRPKFLNHPLWPGRDGYAARAVAILGRVTTLPVELVAGLDR